MSINSSSANENHYHYEEFLSESAECPTCRGLGRIRKGAEELVALIPVSDSRLKPRKTVLYVVISVAISAIVGGLLLFFLISRSITLDSDQQLITPSLLKYDNISNTLLIRYQVPINVSNDNYLAIKVSKLSLSSLLYGDSLLNSSTNYTSLTVPMRSIKLHYVTAEITVGSSPSIKPVVTSCLSDATILWKLGMDFEVQAEINYMSHSETTSITLYNRKVCCHVPDDKSHELLPPLALDCSTL